jgi:uncharacterized protein YecE (DUF72 family)
VKEISLAEFLPRLEATLAQLPQSVRSAVEVRNKAWVGPELLHLLSAYGAAAVLVDHIYMPGPEEQLARRMVTTDFAYVRLLGDRHGIEKKTRRWGEVVEDKSDRTARWSQVIRELSLREDVRQVLAFANNHYAGHAPATCRELASRLGVRLPLAASSPNAAQPGAAEEG